MPEPVRWDAAHAAGESPVLTSVRRRTICAALPPDVAPTTIWPSWPLDRIAEELELGVGDVLLDMGCGRGDIGIWLASHAGAHLVGVDPSAVGLDAARARAEGPLGDRARFLEGRFGDIPLEDAAVDVAVLVDSLQFAEDRVPALREVARVVAPGRRVVVVGPDRSSEPAVADFAAAGLDVEVRSETAGWRDLVDAYRDALGREEVALRRELGDGTTDWLLDRPTQALATTGWHGLVAARRRARPATTP